jgi:hypothetical protein
VGYLISRYGSGVYLIPSWLGITEVFVKEHRCWYTGKISWLIFLSEEVMAIWNELFLREHGFQYQGKV